MRQKMKAIKILPMFFMMFSLYGCASTITAKPGGSSGIPYYLPKPYLLIAKNLCLVQTKTMLSKKWLKQQNTMNHKQVVLGANYLSEIERAVAAIAESPEI